jgi:hypothetical protein
MPDGGGFEVLVDELRAHASRLDGLADRLNTAVDAGQQVTLGAEAYGKICSFFVPIVQAVSAPGVEALGQASTSMTDTGVGVRDTATAYENREQSNTTVYTGGA